MNKLKNRFSITLLIALLTMVTIRDDCSADLSAKLLNAWGFTRTTTTIEHLDHGHYHNTQVTSGWNSSRYTTFTVSPEVIWTINPINTYVKLLANVGWVIDGRNIEYPLRWDLDGDTRGFGVEVGYIWDVCGLFSLLPCVGFDYDIYDLKLQNQEFSHRNIGSYIRQNGNKSHTLLYFPYIGFEVDFKSKLFNEYDVQYSVSYNLGYGGGHNRNSVNHTVITDLPSTTRNGNYTKYRDLIQHDLEFTVDYSPSKKWVVSLEFDYNIYYNTHKLPLKYNHNSDLVAAGQYTHSQYHRVSDLVSHEYSLIFEIVYNLSGDGGTFISH
jgi:hypothetical protein